MGRVWPLAALAFACCASLCGRQDAGGCQVRVAAQDQQGNPVEGAAIELASSETTTVVETGGGGVAAVSVPGPGSYQLRVSKAGFESVQEEIAVDACATTEVQVVLTPPMRLRESITVEAGLPRPGASRPNTVTRSQVNQLPGRATNVREALPLIPGVTRTPEGKLRISDRPEHQNLLLVNSIDVTDPGTGDFGATVPIDAVAGMEVYKSPFLAEYGRFTSAVVAVDTRRGDDTWRWELNDPTPEVRIRSGRLVGIRGFTPRLTAGGPVVKDRLYALQSVEYVLKKTPVFTLQFPENETKREAVNSLTQLDYVVSPTHLLSFTAHAVPQKINFVNLDFYNPQPTTPSFKGHEVRASLADRLGVGGGTLESAVSIGQVTAAIGAQGDEEFTLRPNRNEGNYFSRQRRRSDRLQWLEQYSPGPFERAGTHQFRFGGTLLYSRMAGEFLARPVNVRDWNGRLRRRIEYLNRGPFRLRDWEAGMFLQDNWTVRPGMMLDLGLRADYQEAAGLLRLAPRAGLSWSPFGNAATVLRSGAGLFYDRVPLNAYGFEWYPRQSVTEFGADGTIDGPRTFLNVTQAAGGAGFPLIFGSDGPGDFAPRSATWRAQLEQRLHRYARVRATYLESRSSGLVRLRPGAVGGQDALLLGGDGKARHREVELIAKISWRDGQEFVASYVYSRSRGPLNDFVRFLGNYPAPLVRDDVVTVLPGNIPHRFLAWGVQPLSKRWRIAPMAEWRTGFPYAAVDEAQNYAGVPNTRRFPNFFSLDLRVSRDIEYRRHLFRVSFSVFNLTNHWNPDTVRLNVADPQFGEFLGQHKRRFRVDFDILF